MQSSQSYLRPLMAIIFLCFSYFQLKSDPPKEGMWLPLLIDQLNISDMQSLGCRLSAEDIYSVNQSSLKDAIVSFGGGCTGSIISPQGLLLTNHHCGYGRIQSHSSVENDYLSNGFWAKSHAEELPNPGLFVTFIVRIEDVTNAVLGNVDEADRSLRQMAIELNIADIEAAEIEGTHYEARVVPFFEGNQYYLFITETFNDIRLVGAPPSSIGKFGGDTDNWMWPRHTGDFSLFRVYASPDNLPAEYSEENIPYTPKHFLPITLDGIEKGDFTMVFGFPGRTQEYLTSWGVDQVMNRSDPARIKIRGMRLDVIEADMKTSDKIRIQYASKQSGISNGYKKWQGEIRGLKKLNAVQHKKESEMAFQAWADKEQKTYSGLLPAYETTYNNLGKYLQAYDYFNEAAFGIELVSFVSRFYRLSTSTMVNSYTDETLNDMAQKLLGRVNSFFKDYNPPTDRKLFPMLLQTYYEDIDRDFHPEIFRTIQSKFKGDFEKYADYVFDKSIFLKQADLTAFLEGYSRKSGTKLKTDPAFQLMESFVDLYKMKIRPGMDTNLDAMDSLDQVYMRALMEMKNDKIFYADANSTMRISYGQVDDYQPRDGVHYRWYTTLDGVIEKSKQTDVADYIIPDKLRELYAAKDYGPYDVDGTMPVCFTASNHTTGGNSGSPVINADGQLIGLNFDRNWEGTMSDIMYDPDRCRNISVDIRYVVFIIDKFAGAENIIHEISLMKSKPENH